MSFNLTVQKDFDGDLSKREGFNCLPFIETPLTRTVDHNFTLQKGPCARYEMDFARCADRIGLERSLTDCKKYMQDMHECAHKLKAVGTILNFMCKLDQSFTIDL